MRERNITAANRYAKGMDRGIALQFLLAYVLSMTQIKTLKSQRQCPSPWGEKFYKDYAGRDRGMCLCVHLLATFSESLLHFSIRFKTINYVKPES